MHLGKRQVWRNCVIVRCREWLSWLWNQVSFSCRSLAITLSTCSLCFFSSSWIEMFGETKFIYPEPIYLESLHEDVEPFCFFLSSGRVEILVVYELCRSLLELLDLLGVLVFRYMDVVHGETPEGGAELGRHVLPHPGGEVRHHGLDDRGHHQLRRLRVLHMLLRHSPLLPQLVSLP